MLSAAEIETLQRQLTKEKLTTQFFKESERAALQALENTTVELKAVKKDLASRVELQTRLQHDIGILQATNANLHQQSSLLQTELGERTKQVTSLKLELADAKKSREKASGAAAKELERAEAEKKILLSQIHILTECVKSGNSASPELPEHMKLQLDAENWKRKAVGLGEELDCALKELEHTKYLWKEERMESQRANVLLLCSQRFLESVLTAPQGENGLLLKSKEEQEVLQRLQDMVNTLTTSQLSEIIRDSTEVRREAETLKDALATANKLAAQYKSELAGLKEKWNVLAKSESTAKSQLVDQKASQLLRDREDKLRMIEQGSITSILMTFFTAPSRCPHCGGGLSDTLGLDLLAEAAGCPSVDSLIDIMVSSVSTRISSIYRETFLDQVASLTPVSNIAMAHQLVGPVPKALMFFPPNHFAGFLEQTEFVSESQAYYLATQFMTVGARFTCSQEIVDKILDSVRFLWLGSALIESEISRIEGEVLSMQYSPQGVVPDRCVLPRPAHLALMVPRSLLARLTQALRIRSSALQFSAAAMDDWKIRDVSQKPFSMPEMFNPKGEVVAEMRRLRSSYTFIPTSIRETWHAKGGPSALPVPTLLELQCCCI